MKKLTLITALIFTVSINVFPQKQKLAVLHLDTRGLVLTPEDMSSLVIIEMEKTDKYEVMDKYDLQYLVNKDSLVLEDCYGKTCAIEIGQHINVDKVISGSVERYNEKIIYTLRIIDIKTNVIEKSEVHEFVNLQPHLQKMSMLMCQKLLGLPQDESLLKELSYVQVPIINETNRLKASGPRMGLAYIGPGKTRDFLNKQGIYPVMTQFGYQHEAQYLSSGNFQALFEFVGFVSGMDQGLFIPSVSFMNGFRNSKSGLEFAFGPTFSIKEDTEGYINLSSGFVYAIGKTFKSGHLNLPVNLFISPSKKDSWYYGLSCGFNVSRSSLRR